ncbi:MAG: phosphotransferase [Candidatus Kaiserbacteria bacterium]|nr:phosphotransferase [Candidatus Kaiserbacteria bacterium]
MPEHITLNGERFQRVARQQIEGRHKALVYKGADSYLRIGQKSAIQRDLKHHREMAAAGFPVAKILATGEHGGQSYFIETSLGEKTFRVLFDENFREKCAIDDALFDSFIDVTRRYLAAQLSARVPAAPAVFRQGIRVDELRAELPQYSISLDMRFSRTCERLSAYPYVLSHGDLGPANMMPGGVLDLEDTFVAPFGFDAVSALTTIDWFPSSPDFEFQAVYSYSTEQRARYFAMCDEVATSHQLPAISDFKEDLEFGRAVWLAVAMYKWPRIQKWRYDRFIRAYLLM